MSTREWPYLCESRIGTVIFGQFQAHTLGDKQPPLELGLNWVSQLDSWLKNWCLALLIGWDMGWTHWSLITWAHLLHDEFVVSWMANDLTDKRHLREFIILRDAPNFIVHSWWFPVIYGWFAIAVWKLKSLSIFSAGHPLPTTTGLVTHHYPQFLWLDVVRNSTLNTWGYHHGQTQCTNGNYRPLILNQ